MDTEVSFELQDPKCDPEKLLRAFQRYRIRNWKVGGPSTRSHPAYFKIGDLKSWFRYLYGNHVGGFDIGEFPDIMYQLLHIWREAGFIREMYDDEKIPQNQLYLFTRESISDTK
jgi:hypothetical protein